jgi:mRNA-degrading endonuclease RelE of RelBE toxin-antitoxin system
MTVYSVRFKKSAKRELQSLEQPVRKQILEAVDALALNPTPVTHSGELAQIDFCFSLASSRRVFSCSL